MTAVAFPRLSDANHRITSPATTRYNCVAWAANDTAHWWQPGSYWPIAASVTECGIAVLEQAFTAIGYENCGMNTVLEPEYDKVALYGANMFYTHVARQLPTGKWTSKLGRDVDIEHDSPAAVAGGVYGEVMLIMRRFRLPE